MAMPKFDEFFSPILQYLKEKNEPISRKELSNFSISHFKPTQEDLEDIISSGSSKFIGRMGWAIVYLNKAELIEYVAKGVYKITSSGNDFIISNPEFRLAQLKENPALKKWLIKSNDLGRKNNERIENIEQENSLDGVTLALITQDLDLDTEILNALEQWGNNTTEKGKFFEDLCLELLLKMKYGIDGEVVGGSGDKGVDIILKIDKLGFEKIGVQCKCYKDTPVPSKDIAYFESGLKKKGLVKGIFITTSKFSKEALLDIERNPNIIPIDSNLLVELMKDYEVGVRSETKKIYILDIKEGLK